MQMSSCGIALYVLLPQCKEMFRKPPWLFVCVALYMQETAEQTSRNSRNSQERPWLVWLNRGQYIQNILSYTSWSSGKNQL